MFASDNMYKNSFSKKKKKKIPCSSTANSSHIGVKKQKSSSFFPVPLLLWYSNSTAGSTCDKGDWSKSKNQWKCLNISSFIFWRAKRKKKARERQHVKTSFSFWTHTHSRIDADQCVLWGGILCVVHTLLIWQEWQRRWESRGKHCEPGLSESCLPHSWRKEKKNVDKDRNAHGGSEVNHRGTSW